MFADTDIDDEPSALNDLARRPGPLGELVRELPNIDPLRRHAETVARTYLDFERQAIQNLQQAELFYSQQYQTPVAEPDDYTPFDRTDHPSISVLGADTDTSIVPLDPPSAS